MTTQINASLTNTPLAFILAPLSQKTKVRPGILEIHGANRHQRGFFMRKISVLHIMSDWVGSREAGRVVCPVFQPVQSGAMLGLMMLGLKPFTHEMQS